MSTHDHEAVFDGSNLTFGPPPIKVVPRQNGKSGSWFTAEALRNVRFMESSDMDLIQWDKSKDLAWIPHTLANKLGLGQGKPWTPASGGPPKKPNDRGVIRYLARRCREVLP